MMSTKDRTDKYERIAGERQHLIESGTFAPGDRVPSVQQISQQKAVSISTLMRAYYWLEARGWVEARERSGFYVRTALPTALPEPEVSSPLADPTAVTMRELVTRIGLTDVKNPHLIHLGAAYPDRHLVASAQLHRALVSVAREMGPAIGEYDYVPGNPRSASPGNTYPSARRNQPGGAGLRPGTQHGERLHGYLQFQ